MYEIIVGVAVALGLLAAAAEAFLDAYTTRCLLPRKSVSFSAIVYVSEEDTWRSSVAMLK